MIIDPFATAATLELYLLGGEKNSDPFILKRTMNGLYGWH